MRTLGNILLMVLVQLGAAALEADTKSPAVLLQEALYQEETEGNLDKAIELYGQVLEQAADMERVAAQATYQMGLCHLKKGNQTAAADYFRKIINRYSQQTSIVKNANEQLAKIAPSESDILFVKLPAPVLQAIANMYGQTCAKAGLQNLYTNSNIHYVDSDFVSCCGGYGYYTNDLTVPLTQKIRLSGTSYPNQTHYDIAARKMNTEIVPDKDLPNFYHIYWTPDEPLPPGHFFLYGWCMHESKKLPMAPGIPNGDSGEKRLVTIENHFGNHAFEVFYLVIPNDLQIVEPSEAYTNSQRVGEFTIYAWEKEVGPDENHVVSAYLAKNEFAIRTWVETFFKQNYRDITARKTLEWGEPTTDDNGQISLRYKYEATIWGKDIKINDQIFTFDKSGTFISVKDANP